MKFSGKISKLRNNIIGDKIGYFYPVFYIDSDCEFIGKFTHDYEELQKLKNFAGVSLAEEIENIIKNKDKK